MADYLVGIICKPSGQTDFAYQSSNLQMEADEYEAKDENGNTVAVNHRNHRVTLDIEALIPANTGVPVPGDTILLTNLELPTIGSTGTVTGSFKVNSNASTSISFKVNGTPSISQSNTDYLKCSFSAVRYLVNGLPSSSSSSSN